MASFNENLGAFLTECRNNALVELKSNERYADWKRKQSELRSGLEAAISAEAAQLLEDYLEVGLTVQGMEINKALLCGLTIQSDIRRRFDTSSDEYLEFTEEYL